MPGKEALRLCTPHFFRALVFQDDLEAVVVPLNVACSHDGPDALSIQSGWVVNVFHFDRLSD